MAQAFFTPRNAASSRTWLISTMRASAQAFVVVAGRAPAGAGASSGASARAEGGAKDTTGAGSTRGRGLAAAGADDARAARAARVAAGKEAGSYSRPPPPALPGRGREDARARPACPGYGVRTWHAGQAGQFAGGQPGHCFSPLQALRGALVPSELREALARYGGPALSGCVRRVASNAATELSLSWPCCEARCGVREREPCRELADAAVVTLDVAPRLPGVPSELPRRATTDSLPVALSFKRGFDHDAAPFRAFTFTRRMDFVLLRPKLRGGLANQIGDGARRYARTSRRR